MKRLNDLGPRARAAVLEAAEHYELKPDEVLSRRRLREYVRARKRACETLHRQGWTLTQIARVFDYHHATVLHLLRRDFGDGAAS